MIIKIKKDKYGNLSDFIREYPEFINGVEDEIIKLETIYSKEQALNISKQLDTLKTRYSTLGLDCTLNIIDNLNAFLLEVITEKKPVSPEYVDACLIAINIFNTIHKNIERAILGIDPIRGIDNDIEFEIDETSILQFNNLINTMNIGKGLNQENYRADVSFNNDLLQQFIVEEIDFANQIENILLQVESNPDAQKDVELINTIFRALHSMKGGAALILSTASGEVPKNNPILVFRTISHSAEAVLQKIRDGKGILTTEITNRLFVVVDNLKMLLNCISGNETIPSSVLELLGKSDDFFIAQNEIRKDIIGAKEKTNVESPGKNKAQFMAFQNVATQSLEAIEQCHKKILEQNLTLDQKNLDKYIRSLKNLNSSAAYLYYPDLIALIQQSKDILISIREGKSKFDNLLWEVLCETYEKIKEYITKQIIEKNQSQQQEDLSKKEDKVQNIPILREKPVPADTGKDVKLSEISNTLRVKNDKIDKLMNLIGELIVTKNMFSHISRKLLVEYNLPQIGREVKEIGSMISRIADGLQNTIMDVRMVPIKNVFQKFPRMIRDLSKAMGKEINLVLIGEETHLDKIIIEKISDPLIHIIRNSIDHGIEGVEERKRKNKNPVGTITLKAESRGNIIHIEITDDGKGIDPEMIKLKALEKELITIDEAERMNNKDAYNLLFLPGFSTAEKVSEISGRGVGMDVVKANITEINGTIDMISEPGKGTSIRLLLPLTLVISKGLVVTVNKQDYILPLESIQETIKVPSKRIHKFKQHYVTEIRDEVISLIPLYELFRSNEEPDSQSSMESVLKNSLVKLIILNINGQKAGLVVDEFSNEQEIVIKPLNHDLAKVKGISGATIMGDGSIVLIINPVEIFQLMYKKLLSN